MTALVVGYNSARTLQGCLAGLERATETADLRLAYIENGEEPSPEFSALTTLPSVVLPSQGNVGFAQANNLLARSASTEWLLLVNPDAEMESGTLDVLLDAAVCNPGVAAFGALELDFDGNPAGTRSPPKIGSLFASLFMLKEQACRHRDDVPLIEVPMLSGSLFLIRRETWQALSGMDESFFLYGEDADFFKRLEQSGGKAAIVTGARYRHDTGSGDRQSPRRLTLLAAGISHYQHKHFAPPIAWLGIALQWLIGLSRYLPGRLLAWKSARWADLARGYRPIVFEPRSWIHGYRSPGSDPRRS